MYSDEGKTDLVKTCSVSKHSETKKVKGELPVVFDRLKIVPRGKMDGWNVTGASKVHIPTMFLSISRMLPLGENIFGDPPFRMLGKMKIEISDRITAIAGHNGVGKSTILGLIANGSEIKRSQGATMFNRAFQAQFHELFVLDEKSDYIDSRKQKPYVK